MFTIPFLKWAGGKRWLAPRLAALLGSPLDARLVEPFVGSGAIFFALRPASALLGDTNDELISAFRAVRDAPLEIIERLSKLEVTRSTFDVIRDSKPSTDIGRACRLIYLNRTAFNGLYRVNRKGQFNVPYGCKEGTQTCDADAITKASELLASTTLRRQDFRKTLNRISPGKDVLYVDPPYTIKHNDNGFRRYNEQIFSWRDQEELADRLSQLARCGTRIVVSNANHDAIRVLYPKELFHSYFLARRSSMAANPEMRGVFSEVLLISRTICKNYRKLEMQLNLES